MRSRFYTEAMKWARQGYPVFPCNGKAPAIPEDDGGQGCKDGTTDEPAIRSWAERFPNANVGITFRNDGREVGIDVDADTNFVWLDRIQREHGILDTKTVKTGKGGLHFYYVRPAGVTIPNIGKASKKGYEVKSHNQYLMAPGSIHPETRKLYELVRDIDPQPMPDWLVAEILRDAGAGPGGDGHKAADTRTAIFEGEGRNSACTEQAGRLLRIYQKPEIVRPMVQAYNQAVCVPPLTEEELSRTTFKSLEKWARQEAHREVVGTPTEPRHLTDLGNMERLITNFGADMRYCQELKDWLVWDGKRWKRDQSAVVGFAKTTARAVYHEAAEAKDADTADKIAKWAKQSESQQRINAMIALAESDPTVRVSVNELDTNPWLLNCKNGTVDLRTGETKNHDRADLITRIIQLEYRLGERSAVWESFLERILPDTDTRAFTKRAMGYSANGSQHEQAMMFAYGGGFNGKSTLLGACQDVLGDYAAECDPSVFMTSMGKDSGPNEGIANLRKVRLLVSTELEDNQRLAVSLVKRATGGESLTSNRKYEHAFTFRPEFTLWLAGNHEPEIRDTTSSIWNRMRKIPFNVTIPECDRMKGLRDILSGQHGEAILAWIIDGAIECHRDGLGTSREVNEATAKYREDQDVLHDFLAERIISQPDVYATPTKDVYKAYLDWASANGVKYPMGKQTFNNRMREKGYRDKRATDNKLVWVGLGIIT